MSIENPVYKLISVPLSDAVDSQLLLAAKASGLELSLDGGETWQDAYHSLGIDDPLGTLAVDTAPLGDSQIQVFAGLSGGILLASWTQGFEEFPWQTAQVPSPPPVITDFAISPDFVADGLILAATLEDGVLRSNNHGKSWTGWSFNLLDRTVLCLAISPHFVDDNTVFAGTESGLFRSKNGGKSWIEIPLPTDHDPILSIALSPDFGMDGCLWVSTETQGLWFTQDHGEQWELVKGLGTESPINAIQIFRSQEGQQQISIMSNEGIKFNTISEHLEVEWQDFQPQSTSDAEITAICAPSGLGQGKQFWLGFSDGQVKSFTK